MEIKQIFCKLRVIFPWKYNLRIKDDGDGDMSDEINQQKLIKLKLEKKKKINKKINLFLITILNHDCIFFFLNFFFNFFFEMKI